MSVFRSLIMQTFDTGGLPKEYQRVEWIAGTSKTKRANYLDLGIKMQANIEITLGISWNKSYNPNYDRVAGFDTLGWIEAGSANSSITLTSKGTYSSIGSTRSEVKITTQNWLVNGNVIQTYTAPTFGDSNIILLSNAVGAYTDSDGRWSIWDCLIKVGDNILFNGIPCYRKSDNVIGMYDLVSKTFIINSGSGTLEKGDDIL